MLYCGWDGGGTKTEVCLTDGTGRTLASAVFGPMNLNGSSREQVRETIRACVEYMKEQAGSLDGIGGLVIGLAGISNQNVPAVIRQELAEAGWSGPVQLAGDQEIALAGAVEGAGLLLIAGTGSVCCGRDREGNLFRVGGWGHLIDDGGSGWDIGRKMLAAAVRAEDGRGPKTALTGMIFRQLKIEEVGELITWLYSPETGKRDVAALAALLPEALAGGDAAAETIARQAEDDLAELAETGWRKSGLEAGELALTGSILLRFPAIRERVEQRLRRTCPGLRIAEPRGVPAEGAARMARELRKGSEK